jgi:hypothetical protein
LPPIDPLAEFPLELGSTWVYSATHYDTFETDRITATYRITETVIETQTEPPLSAAKIERTTTLLTTSANLSGIDWQEFYLAGPGSVISFWYIGHENRLYRQDALDWAAVRADAASLEYIFPLTTGERWYPDPNQRANVPNFQIGPGTRTVNGPLAVHVPAGDFENCYELRTFYNGGSPVSWVCPGLGVVESRFDHAGTPFGNHQVLLSHTIQAVAASQPIPSSALVELVVNPLVGQVGEEISVVGRVTRVGLPHYTLYLDGEPLLTVTYDNQVQNPPDPTAPLELVSATATGTEVSLVLKPRQPGQLALSLGASGEIGQSSDQGLIWSWGSATSATKVVTISNEALPAARDTIASPANLSIGDPYAPQLGNLGYEVQHYTLGLALDPAVKFVAGTATLEAVSTLPNLDQLSLDFVGFEVSEVRVDDSPTSFFRQANKLIVNLPQPLAENSTFSLTITYSGEPPQTASPYVPFAPHLGLYFMPNNSLFVVAEPDGGQNWFPANDHPRDKAAFRFELTVPQGLSGVANGVLTDIEPGQALPDGSPAELFIWEQAEPMAPYLATVAVGEYERLEDLSPEGVVLRHYVFPENRAEFEQAVAQAGPALDWMSEQFGPYPFAEFGFATTAAEGFTLETQTMIMLSTGMLRESVVVHEIAHHWFGNWVSPTSWADIWRNEGFATYVVDMWETRDNPAALAQRIAGYQQTLAADPSGFPLNDPPPEQMFGRDSYIKGAVVAHALRQEVGDAAFFAGLRLYFERYGGGTASQAEFQAALEEAAGMSLDDFFAEAFK